MQKKTTHSWVTLCGLFHPANGFAKCGLWNAFFFLRASMRLLLLRAFRKESCFYQFCAALFAPLCEQLLLNVQPHLMLANRVKSLLRFTFPLPQVDNFILFAEACHLCPYALHWSLVALYSLYLKQLSAERCVCMCVVPFLSYFELDCSRK